MFGIQYKLDTVTYLPLPLLQAYSFLIPRFHNMYVSSTLSSRLAVPENITTPSIDPVTLTGPVLLGGYLAWGLFGVLTIQVYTYYQVFPNDKLWTKTLVYTIYLLQGMHAIFVTDNGFRIFAYGFGNLDALDRVGTLWVPLCLLEGIVAFVVQSFYAWRISIISGRKWPTAVIMLVSLFSFASSIVVSVAAVTRGRFSKEIDTVSFIETGIWEGSAATCDIMIASLMTYYLKLRIPSGACFRGTADLVNKIIRSSIETGTITATAAVVMLITIYLSGSDRSDYVCPATIIPGLYSTALLAVLNSRIKSTASSHSTTFKEPSNNRDASVIDMFPNAWSSTDSDGSSCSVANHEISIEIKSKPGTELDVDPTDFRNTQLPDGLWSTSHGPLSA